MTIGEIAFAFAVIGGLMFAFRVFDEARSVLQPLSQIALPSLIVFFVGRGLWRWLRTKEPGVVRVGAWAGLVVAVIGWANVALAARVAGVSEGNYALIIVVPILWMVGLFLSVAGVLAAGLGVFVTAAALRGAISNRGLIASAGVVSVVLNLGHIVQLFRIFSGR